MNKVDMPHKLLFQKGIDFVSETQTYNIESMEIADEQLNYIIPYIWNDFKSYYEYIFPALTNELPNETSLFENIIQGVPLTVYNNNSSNLNMYTMPLNKDKVKSLVSNIPYISVINIILGLRNFLKADITGEPGRDRTIILSSKIPIDIVMWETRALRAILPENELRVAVALHEIGHWANNGSRIALNRTVLTAFTLITSASIITPLILGIFIIIQSRLGEYQADNFVKKMGYGQELSVALDRMYKTKYISGNIILKFNRMIDRITKAIMEIIDKVLPISSHPSFKKRQMRLNESYDLIEEGIVEELIEMLRRIFKNIDKEASELLIHAFPLMK